MRLGKVCTSILFLFTIVNIHAQNIASRTPSNKNVVLEDLSGKSCGWCPDAHKIAQELSDYFEGRVFPLTINAGRYAGASPPNYRTDWGEFIDSVFSIDSYPSGAVNRTDFGDGVMHNRGSWGSNVIATLGEASPVNIGGEAIINLVTRELTLNVETYYVYSVPGPYQRIHVVMSQDNVAGVQLGGFEHYPEQILPDEQYNHNHMVRHALTPVLGDKITNTSTSSSNLNNYQYTIPTQINDIPVNLEDLDITVYVSEKEENGEIITGNHAHFNYVVPLGYTIVDIKVKGDMSEVINLCDQDYQPTAWLFNQGESSVDTIMVRYQVLGKETQDSILYADELLPGDSVLIHFGTPSAVLSGILKYSIQVWDYNSNTAELYLNNNVDYRNIGVALNNVESYSFHEGFETMSPSSQIIHGVHVNPNRLKAQIRGPGGFKASISAFKWLFSDIVRDGQSKILFNKAYVPVPSTNARVKWSYAYAQRMGGEDDRLQVRVSTDCGDSWTSIWDKSGDDMETGLPLSVGFNPNVDEWKMDSVDLLPFAGQEIIIAFEATSDKGNSLLIDDINLAINCHTSATLNAAQCVSYTSPSGNYTWTSSGNYQDTIQNIYGCDSVININLTIDAEFDAGVEQNGSEIYSTLSSASSYLWLDCNQDYKAIVWATNQYFSPPYDGVYAVEVTKNSCVDTSDCFYFINSAIGELTLDAQLRILPNPAKNEVSVTLDSPIAFSVTVVNMLGEIILVKENVMHKTMVDLTKVENGLYYFQVKTDKSTVIKKIIKAE
jgi:hypothetical protein